jgi:hypothetical protein
MCAILPEYDGREIGIEPTSILIPGKIRERISMMA